MKKFYSTEEDMLLREHINNYTYKELAEKLNKEFGRGRTARGVKSHCYNVLGLTSGINGRFSKGGASHNVKKIGTEKWINGYLWVKVDAIKEEIRSRSAYTNNWKPKHIMLWEEKHGAVPKGKQIIFLDGDKTNLEPDNLCCVDLRIMPFMNRNGWISGERDITLTAIKWCELFYLLKETT